MLYLASRSPRRQTLLAQIGVEFSVCVADIDESKLPAEAAENYVQRITRAKAEAALQKYPHDAVLTADTAVIKDQHILGKPSGLSSFREMMKLLSAGTHQVLTGVALAQGNDIDYRLNVSNVTFRPLHDEEILAYWETGEPQDKAGGYAVQGLGAVFIERIEGSYSGIMGLPLFETAAMLRNAGLYRPDWG